MDHDSTDLIDRALARIIDAHPRADVVDIGGGSGTRAVPLALAGCRVLVVDASTDALAILGRRAAEAGVADRVRSLQADADHLDAAVPAGSADLVLYHQVVQDVDDPARSLAAAVRVLRPGGSLSILAPGLLSAVLAASLDGRYRAARELLAGGGGSRYYAAASLRVLMEDAGLVVESVTGIGVIAALSGSRTHAAADADLLELERELGRHPVAGQIAGDLHGVGLAPSR